MSTIFLYEDGHGNVVDESEFIVETIAIHTGYLKDVASSESFLSCLILIEKSKDEAIHMSEANSKRDYVRYTIQDKVRFFDLNIEKCMSASAAQRWANQYNVCPDSIFESCKKVGRKCILTEEHKTTIINFIDANPSATVVEVTEHVLKRFNDLKVSRSIVYNFMQSFIKKKDFHSIERNSPAKIEEQYDWVCK